MVSRWGRSLKKLTSAAKQAAEKGLIVAGIDEEHPSGAKARVDYAAFCGTTKVVP
jgi:hypothetical protein